MKKQIPHQKIIDTSRWVSDVTKYLLLISSCIILAEILYTAYVKPADQTILRIFSVLIFIGFSSYLIFNTCSNIYYYRYSTEKRNDLIDNSLGSSFLTKKSIGYFTNENIEKSIYKFAVNVFENAFFSYTTSINMVRNSAIYTASIAAVLCISAVLGIKDVWLFAIKIPVIAILVLEFSRLCYFVTRTHRVYESFIQFFNSLEGKTILSDAENACALKNILDYETLITWWGFHLDSSIFNSSNPELSKDWIKIKKNLKIPIT